MYVCEKHYPAKKGGPSVDMYHIKYGKAVSEFSFLRKTRYSIIDGIFHYDMSSGFHSERVTLMK